MNSSMFKKISQMKNKLIILKKIILSKNDKKIIKSFLIKSKNVIKLDLNKKNKNQIKSLSLLRPNCFFSSKLSVKNRLLSFKYVGISKPIPRSRDGPSRRRSLFRKEICEHKCLEDPPCSAYSDFTPKVYRVYSKRNSYLESIFSDKSEVYPDFLKEQSIQADFYLSKLKEVLFSFNSNYLKMDNIDSYLSLSKLFFSHLHLCFIVSKYKDLQTMPIIPTFASKSSSELYLSKSNNFEIPFLKFVRSCFILDRDPLTF